MLSSDAEMIRTAIARPRLIELVGLRWHRRVVAVVGGVGLGKSVLLAQMSAENALAPRGVEVSVRCSSAHRSPRCFVESLASALFPEPDVKPIGLDGVLDEMAHRWPAGLCLVIDDVQHVSATAEGRGLLEELISAAPRNTHIVLAGRGPIPGLSAARAAGDVLEIGERDLVFTRGELEALAQLHGCDPDSLECTGGWPAVAAVCAAYGTARATEYVNDEVLAHLDARRWQVLAVAAALGRFDIALLGAAIADGDPDLAGALDAIPLVHRGADGDVEVDGSWNRLLAGSLTPDDRTTIIARAVAVLTERGDYDRAFELCAAHQLWDEAARVLTTCCRRGHARVPRRVLAAWLDAMPADRFDAPEVLLLRGLLGRIVDPFGAETAALLRRATECYRSIGDVGGEIAAASELAYVLRNQGVQEAVPELLARAAALHADGHPEVDGLVALGRGLLAEFAGDDRGMVAELASVPAGSLSREWQAVVQYRLATVHLTLGNQQEMLDAARRCVELAGTSTMRHVDPLAKWYAGDPGPALAAHDALIADMRRSQVDSLALGSFATMVLATGGRVDEAEVQLAAVRRAAHGPVALLMQSYIVGNSALLAAARGDDQEARAQLVAALEMTPLDAPRGWQLASRWLALAYVLCPAARPPMDDAQVGPIHTARLTTARMIVAAREGTSMKASDVATLRPHLIATTAPLPWAMVLAGRLTDDGHNEGRLLAETLFELYGSPARDALRGASRHADRRVARGARQLLKLVALTPDRPLRLEVLGPLQLHRDGVAVVDPEWQRERVRSLLAFLVLHGPVRRDQIIEALWPDLDIDAADRNLRVTLTYLQRLLEPEREKGEAPFYVRQMGTTLAIAGTPHIVLDAHEFEAHLAAAEDAEDRGTPSVALVNLEAALNLWRGECLADVHGEPWAQAVCNDLSSNFVRAALRCGELHLAAGRPAAARRLARRALATDQWSEPAHRLLVAAALADNDRGAAARAMRDCDAMLSELGVSADPATEALRQRIVPRFGVASLAPA